MKVAPDYATSQKVYAGTSGADSCFSASKDGGVTFNGLGMIQVFDTDFIDYLDAAIINSNTMFLLIHDNVDNGTLRDFDATETQMVFKTIDAGTTWERVWFNKSTGSSDGMSILKVSPLYATDSTIYIAQKDSRLWKSTDGGVKFIGLAAPAAITALTVVNGSTYFTGHSAAIYKSGVWVSATVTGTVNSIAVAPGYDGVTNDMVFVGTSSGYVYYSKNASDTVAPSYTAQGAAGEPGTGTTIVAVDPAYAKNKTIYAGSSAGIKRWVVGTSVTWDVLDTGSTIRSMQLAADGTLYAASDNSSVVGIRRNLIPTTALGLIATDSPFATMNTQIPAGATLLDNLAIVSPYDLYAIVLATATDDYKHGYQLVCVTDSFAVTPTLSAPADKGSVDPALVLTLSWAAVAAPAGTTVWYTYDVAYDAAFTNKVTAYNSATTTGTSAIIPPGALTTGMTYYWRVYATSPLTTRRASRSFTLQASSIVMNADVVYPTPGASNVPIRPTFQWSKVPGATIYELEVYRDFELLEIVEKTPGKELFLTVNAYELEHDLDYSHTYYWRVRAKTGVGYTDWSLGIFTTMAEPVAPTPPVVIPPAAPPTIVEVPTPAAIPTALLWAIIGIGAILVIALIVLIVRTRRVS